MTDQLPSKDQVSDDPVNHPKHYTSHPSGIECIQITEHMGFCLGNAVKYIWRADLKADAIEDLKKARWYVDREIQQRERAAQPPRPEWHCKCGWPNDGDRCGSCEAARPWCPSCTKPYDQCRCNGVGVG